MAGTRPTLASTTVLVDTNVLLSASQASRPHHLEALRVLNDWPNQAKRLCTCGQILREYLVVATRPQENNGLGLALDDALLNVAAIRQRMLLLEENAGAVALLHELLQEVRCHGKQIHDVNLVALALYHRVGSIVTANVADFLRFKDHITVLKLGN